MEDGVKQTGDCLSVPRPTMAGTVRCQRGRGDEARSSEEGCTRRRREHDKRQRKSRGTVPPPSSSRRTSFQRCGGDASDLPATGSSMCQSQGSVERCCCSRLPSSEPASSLPSPETSSSDSTRSPASCLSRTRRRRSRGRMSDSFYGTNGVQMSSALCPFLVEHERSRVTTVLLNCLSLSQFELARAILHQLVLSDPRHAISLAAALALHGPPPTWLCSASVPSSAHLAWLCAHELLHICKVVRALPAPTTGKEPPKGGREASGRFVCTLTSPAGPRCTTNSTVSKSRCDARLSSEVQGHAPSPCASCDSSPHASSSFSYPSPPPASPGCLCSPSFASGVPVAAPLGNSSFTPHQADLSLTSIFPLWLLRRLHMDLILAQALLDCASHGTSILSVEVATELRILHAVLLGCPLQAGDASESTVPPSREPGRVGVESLDGDRNTFNKEKDSTKAPERPGATVTPSPTASVGANAGTPPQESSSKGTSHSSFRSGGSSFSCLCPEVVHLPSLLLLPLPYTLPASLSRLPACIVSRRNRLATYAQGSPVLSFDAVNQLSALMKSHPAAALALFEAIGYIPASVLALGASAPLAPVLFSCDDTQKSRSLGLVSSLPLLVPPGLEGRSRSAVVQGHATSAVGEGGGGRDQVPAHTRVQRKARSQSPGDTEDAGSHRRGGGTANPGRQHRIEKGEAGSIEGKGEDPRGVDDRYPDRVARPALQDTTAAAVLRTAAISSITWEERDSTGQQRFVVDPASIERSLFENASRTSSLPPPPPQPVVLEPLYSPPWRVPRSRGATALGAHRALLSSWGSLKEVGAPREGADYPSVSSWTNVAVVSCPTPGEGTRSGEQTESLSRRRATEYTSGSCGTSREPPCRREGAGEMPGREGEESADETEDDGWVFLGRHASGAGYRVPGSRLLRTPISGTSAVRAAYAPLSNRGVQSMHPADKTPYGGLTQPPSSVQTGELLGVSPRSAGLGGDSARPSEDVADFSAPAAAMRQSHFSRCHMQTRLYMEAAFHEGMDLFSFFFPRKTAELPLPTGLEVCAAEVLIRVVRKLHELHVGVAAESLLERSGNRGISWSSTSDYFSPSGFRSDTFHHLQRLDSTAGILPLCAALSRPQVEYGYAQSLSIAFACALRSLLQGTKCAGGRSGLAILGSRCQAGWVPGALHSHGDREEEKGHTTSSCFSVEVVDPLRVVRAELLRQSLQSHFQIVSLLVALYDDCKNERLLPRLRPLLANLATFGVTSAVNINRRTGSSPESPQVPSGGGANQAGGVAGGGQNAPGGPAQGAQAQGGSGFGGVPASSGTASLGSTGHRAGGGAPNEGSTANAPVDAFAGLYASPSEGGTWRPVGSVAQQPNSIARPRCGKWGIARALREPDEKERVQLAAGSTNPRPVSLATCERSDLVYGNDEERTERETETDDMFWEEGGVLRKCVWLDLNAARCCLTEVFEASMLPLLKEAEEARREAAHSFSSRASLVSLSSVYIPPSHSASRRPSATHSEASTAFRVDPPSRPHLPSSLRDPDFTSETSERRFRTLGVKVSPVRASDSVGQRGVARDADFLGSGRTHAAAPDAAQEDRARQSSTLTGSERQSATSRRLQIGGVPADKAAGVSKESPANMSPDRGEEGDEERGGQKPAARASRFFSKFLNQLTASGAGGERPTDSKDEGDGECGEARRQQWVEGQSSRDRKNSDSRAAGITTRGRKTESGELTSAERDVGASKEESGAGEAAAVSGASSGTQGGAGGDRGGREDDQCGNTKGGPTCGDHRSSVSISEINTCQDARARRSSTSSFSLAEGQSNVLGDTADCPAGCGHTPLTASSRLNVKLWASEEGDLETTMARGPTAGELPSGDGDRATRIEECESSVPHKSVCQESDEDGGVGGGIEGDRVKKGQREACRTSAGVGDEQKRDLGIFGRCPPRSTISRLSVYEALLSHVPLSNSRPLVTPPPLSTLRQLEQAARGGSVLSLERFGSRSELAGAIPNEYARQGESLFPTPNYGELHYLTLQLYAHLDDHWVRLKMAHLALPPAFDLIRTPAGGVSSLARPLLRRAQDEFYSWRKQRQPRRLPLVHACGAGPGNCRRGPGYRTEEKNLALEPESRLNSTMEDEEGNSSLVHHDVLKAAPSGRGSPEGHRFMSEEVTERKEACGEELRECSHSDDNLNLGQDRELDGHVHVDIGQASDVAAEEEVAFATAFGIPLPAFWDSYYACLRVTKQHCVEFPLRTAIELVLDRELVLASRLLTPFPQLRPLVVLLCWSAFEGRMLLRQQLLDLVWQEGYLIAPPDDGDRDDHQLAIKGLDKSCLEKGKASRSVTTTSLTSNRTTRVDRQQGKSDTQHLSRGVGGGAISDERVAYPLSEGCLDDLGGVDGDSRGGGSCGEGKEGMPRTEDAAEGGFQEKGKERLQSNKAARTEQSGASGDTEQLEGGRKRGSWSCTQGDAQVRKHLQILSFKMAASWWLARLLLAHGQRQPSSRTRSITPPSATSSAVFRESAVARASEAATRLRAVCGSSVSKSSTVPVNSEYGSPSQVEAYNECGTGRVPFSGMGLSSSRKQEQEYSEAGTVSVGDDRLQAGVSKSLDDKLGRGDDGKDGTSTGWEGRHGRKGELGGISEEEEEDFIKGKASIDAQGESEGDAGGEAAWIAAEIFDDLQRHSILYVVRARCRLPLISVTVFFSGLSALPHTDRAATVLERSHDEDVAYMYFALRAAIQLVEDCCNVSCSLPSSAVFTTPSLPLPPKNPSCRLPAHPVGASGSVSSSDLQSDTSVTSPHLSKSVRRCTPNASFKKSGSPPGVPATSPGHLRSSSVHASPAGGRAKPQQKVIASSASGALARSSASSMHQPNRPSVGQTTCPDLSGTSLPGGTEWPSSTSSPNNGARDGGGTQQTGGRQDTGRTGRWLWNAPGQSGHGMALGSMHGGRGSTAVGEEMISRKHGELGGGKKGVAFVQMRLREVVPLLNDLIRAVKRVSYRVSLLLHLCSLCFTAAAPPTSGRLAGEQQSGNSCSQTARQPFVVPPSVLLSVVMLVRAHLELLEEEQDADILDGSNVDSDEGHGMPGCFSEMKKNKIGVSLFIRALDLFTRELLWRGQLCLEQFFDATALCSVSDASLARPFSLSSSLSESVDHPGIYELPFLRNPCSPDGCLNCATSSFGQQIPVRGYPTGRKESETLGAPEGRCIQHRSRRSSVIFSPRWIAWCRRIGAVVTLRPGSRVSSSRPRQSSPGLSLWSTSATSSLPPYRSQPHAEVPPVMSPASACCPVSKTLKSGSSSLQNKEVHSDLFLGKAVQEDDDWILSPGLGPETYAAMPALDSFPFVSAASVQTAEACRAVLRFTTPLASHTPQPHLRISLEANPFLLYLLSSPSILVARTLQLNDFASCARLMEYFELPESIKAGVAVAQAFFELRRVLTTGRSRQEDDVVDVLVERSVRSMSDSVLRSTVISHPLALPAVCRGCPSAFASTVSSFSPHLVDLSFLLLGARPFLVPLYAYIDAAVSVAPSTSACVYLLKRASSTLELRGKSMRVVPELERQEYATKLAAAGKRDGPGSSDEAGDAEEGEQKKGSGNTSRSEEDFFIGGFAAEAADLPETFVALFRTFVDRLYVLLEARNASPASSRPLARLLLDVEALPTEPALLRSHLYSLQKQKTAVASLVEALQLIKEGKHSLPSSQAARLFLDAAVKTLSAELLPSTRDDHHTHGCHAPSSSADRGALPSSAADSVPGASSPVHATGNGAVKSGTGGPTGCMDSDGNSGAVANYSSKTGSSGVDGSDGVTGGTCVLSGWGKGGGASSKYLLHFLEYLSRIVELTEAATEKFDRSNSRCEESGRGSLACGCCSLTDGCFYRTRRLKSRVEGRAPGSVHLPPEASPGSQKTSTTGDSSACPLAAASAASPDADSQQEEPEAGAAPGGTARRIPGQGSKKGQHDLFAILFDLPESAIAKVLYELRGRTEARQLAALMDVDLVSVLVRAATPLHSYLFRDFAARAQTLKKQEDTTVPLAEEGAKTNYDVSMTDGHGDIKRGEKKRNKEECKEQNQSERDGASGEGALEKGEDNHTGIEKHHTSDELNQGQAEGEGDTLGRVKSDTGVAGTPVSSAEDTGMYLHLPEGTRQVAEKLATEDPPGSAATTTVDSTTRHPNVGDKSAVVPPDAEGRRSAACSHGASAEKHSSLISQAASTAYVLSMNTALLLGDLEQPLRGARAEDVRLLAATACLERLTERWPSRAFFRATLGMIGPTTLSPLRRWIEERMRCWDAICEAGRSEDEERNPSVDVVTGRRTTGVTFQKIETRGWTPEELAQLPPHLRGLLLAVADDAEISIEACARSQAVGLVRRGLLQRALRLVDQTLPAGNSLQKAILHKLLSAHRAKKNHCNEESFLSAVDHGNDLASHDDLCATHREVSDELRQALVEELGQPSNATVGCNIDLPLPNCISREENAVAATESALALYHSWDVRTVQAALTCCLRRLRAEEAQSALSQEKQVRSEKVSGIDAQQAERGSVMSTDNSWSENSSDDGDQRDGKDSGDLLGKERFPASLFVEEDNANRLGPAHTVGQEAVQERVAGEELHDSVNKEDFSLDSAVASVSRQDSDDEHQIFLSLDRVPDVEATGVPVALAEVPNRKHGMARYSSRPAPQSLQSPPGRLSGCVSPLRRASTEIGCSSGSGRLGSVGERRRDLITRVTNVLELMAAYREAMELCGQRWRVWQELEALCQSPEGMRKVVEVLLHHEGHTLARTLIKASPHAVGKGGDSVLFVAYPLYNHPDSALLPRVQLSSLLHVFATCDDKTSAVRTLLSTPPREAIRLGFRMLQALDRISDRLLLCSVLSSRLAGSLSDRERSHLQTLTASLQLLRPVSTRVEPHHEALLTKPPLIVESLLMNARCDLLHSFFESWPQLRDDGLIIRFARKALKLPSTDNRDVGTTLCLAKAVRSGEASSGEATGEDGKDAMPSECTSDRHSVSVAAFCSSRVAAQETPAGVRSPETSKGNSSAPVPGLSHTTEAEEMSTLRCAVDGGGPRPLDFPVPGIGGQWSLTGDATLDAEIRSQHTFGDYPSLQIALELLELCNDQSADNAEACLRICDDLSRRLYCSVPSHPVVRNFVDAKSGSRETAKHGRGAKRDKGHSDASKETTPGGVAACWEDSGREGPEGWRKPTAGRSKRPEAAQGNGEGQHSEPGGNHGGSTVPEEGEASPTGGEKDSHCCPAVPARALGKPDYGEAKVLVPPVASNGRHHTSASSFSTHLACPSSGSDKRHDTPSYVCPFNCFTAVHPSRSTFRSVQGMAQGGKLIRCVAFLPPSLVSQFVRSQPPMSAAVSGSEGVTSPHHLGSADRRCAEIPSNNEVASREERMSGGYGQDAAAYETSERETLSAPASRKMSIKLSPGRQKMSLALPSLRDRRRNVQENDLRSETHFSRASSSSDLANNVHLREREISDGDRLVIAGARRTRAGPRCKSREAPPSSVQPLLTLIWKLLSFCTHKFAGALPTVHASVVLAQQLLSFLVRLCERTGRQYSLKDLLNLSRGMHVRDMLIRSDQLQLAFDLCLCYQTAAIRLRSVLLSRHNSQSALAELTSAFAAKGGAPAPAAIGKPPGELPNSATCRATPGSPGQSPVSYAGLSARGVNREAAPVWVEGELVSARALVAHKLKAKGQETQRGDKTGENSQSALGSRFADAVSDKTDKTSSEGQSSRLSAANYAGCSPVAGVTPEPPRGGVLRVYPVGEVRAVALLCMGEYGKANAELENALALNQVQLDLQRELHLLQHQQEPGEQLQMFPVVDTGSRENRGMGAVAGAFQRPGLEGSQEHSSAFPAEANRRLDGFVRHTGSREGGCLALTGSEGRVCGKPPSRHSLHCSSGTAVNENTNRLLQAAARTWRASVVVRRKKAGRTPHITADHVVADSRRFSGGDHLRTTLGSSVNTGAVSLARKTGWLERLAAVAAWSSPDVLSAGSTKYTAGTQEHETWLAGGGKSYVASGKEREKKSRSSTAPFNRASQIRQDLHQDQVLTAAQRQLNLVQRFVFKGCPSLRRDTQFVRSRASFEPLSVHRSADDTGVGQHPRDTSLASTLASNRSLPLDLSSRSTDRNLHGIANTLESGTASLEGEGSNDSRPNAASAYRSGPAPDPKSRGSLQPFRSQTAADLRPQGRRLGTGVNDVSKKFPEDTGTLVPANQSGHGLLGPSPVRRTVQLSGRTLMALESGIRHVPLFSLPTLRKLHRHVTSIVLHRRLYGVPPRVPYPTLPAEDAETEQLCLLRSAASSNRSMLSPGAGSGPSGFPSDVEPQRASARAACRNRGVTRRREHGSDSFGSTGTCAARRLSASGSCFSSETDDYLLALSRRACPYSLRLLLPPVHAPILQAFPMHQACASAFTREIGLEYLTNICLQAQFRAVAVEAAEVAATRAHARSLHRKTSRQQVPYAETSLVYRVPAQHHVNGQEATDLSWRVSHKTALSRSTTEQVVPAVARPSSSRLVSQGYEEEVTGEERDLSRTGLGNGRSSNGRAPHQKPSGSSVSDVALQRGCSETGLARHPGEVRGEQPKDPSSLEGLNQHGTSGKQTGEHTASERGARGKPRDERLHGEADGLVKGDEREGNNLRFDTEDSKPTFSAPYSPTKVDVDRLLCASEHILAGYILKWNEQALSGGQLHNGLRIPLVSTLREGAQTGRGSNGPAWKVPWGDAASHYGRVRSSAWPGTDFPSSNYTSQAQPELSGGASDQRGGGGFSSSRGILASRASEVDDEGVMKRYPFSSPGRRGKGCFSVGQMLRCFCTFSLTEALPAYVGVHEGMAGENRQPVLQNKVDSAVICRKLQYFHKQYGTLRSLVHLLLLSGEQEQALQLLFAAPSTSASPHTQQCPASPATSSAHLQNVLAALPSAGWALGPGFGVTAAADLLVESLVTRSIALRKLPIVLRSLASSPSGGRGEAFIKAMKLCLRKRRALHTLYAMHIMTRDFLNAGILAVILSLAAGSGHSPRWGNLPGDTGKSLRRRVECRGGEPRAGGFAEPEGQSKRARSAATYDGVCGAARSWDRQVGFLEEALRFLAGVLSEIRKRDSSRSLATAAFDTLGPVGGGAPSTSSLRTPPFTTHAEMSLSSTGRLPPSDGDSGLSAEDSLRVRDDKQSVRPHDISARGPSSKETDIKCELRRASGDTELKSRFFSSSTEPSHPTQGLGDGRRMASSSLSLRRSHESISSSGGGTEGVEENVNKSLAESGENEENHGSSAVATGTCGVFFQQDNTCQQPATEDGTTMAAAWRCELLDSGDQRDLRIEEVDGESLAMLLELLSLQLQCYQSFPSLPGSLSLLAPHQEQRVRACACLLFYGKYDWALRVIRLCNLNQVEVFVQAASLIASKTQKIQRTHEFLTKVTPYMAAEDMDMLALSVLNVWVIEHGDNISQCQQAAYLIPFISSPYRRFDAHLLLSSLCPSAATSSGSSVGASSTTGSSAVFSLGGTSAGNGPATSVAPSSFASFTSPAATTFAHQQLQQCVQLASRLSSPALLQVCLDAAQRKRESQLAHHVQTLIQQYQSKSRRDEKRNKATPPTQ